MSAAAFLVVEHLPFLRRAQAVFRRLPQFSGRSIRVQKRPGLRDRYGAVHAGSFLRERRIVLSCTGDEFARVFVHELFHFVWLRLGNRSRRSYEELLRHEFERRARGELGWSAQWRKTALRPEDVRNRSRRWREYCCESFCDSAAWLYSGRSHHPEFTLAGRFRHRRGQWFAQITENANLSV